MFNNSKALFLVIQPYCLIVSRNKAFQVLCLNCPVETGASDFPPEYSLWISSMFTLKSTLLCSPTFLKKNVSALSFKVLFFSMCLCKSLVEQRMGYEGVHILKNSEKISLALIRDKVIKPLLKQHHLFFKPPIIMLLSFPEFKPFFKRNSNIASISNAFQFSLAEKGYDFCIIYKIKLFFNNILVIIHSYGGVWKNNCQKMKEVH